MKITKRRLKKIIKEEKAKLIKEQWGSNLETGSDLIDFAKSYSSLGSAVQQQVEALSNAYMLQGAHEPDWSETVYNQNPNAVDIAIQRLSPGLNFLAREGVEEADLLLDMFKEAQNVYTEHFSKELE